MKIQPSDWEKIISNEATAKGLLHAKIGTIKDGNGTDIIEAEDIKKRWQEYTEGLYQKKKKNLNDPDNLDSVISHLQPDILECKVKWA